jgi:hypothetical protein
MNTKSKKPYLIAFSIALNSCCMFKEGSWAPLPSCENAEKHAAKKSEMMRTQNAE